MKAAAERHMVIGVFKVQIVAICHGIENEESECGMLRKQLLGLQ